MPSRPFHSESSSAGNSRVIATLSRRTGKSAANARYCRSSTHDARRLCIRLRQTAASAASAAASSARMPDPSRYGRLHSRRPNMRLHWKTNCTVPTTSSPRRAER